MFRTSDGREDDKLDMNIDEPTPVAYDMNMSSVNVTTHDNVIHHHDQEKTDHDAGIIKSNL